ncbi:heat repeat containing 2 [Nannochloropsis oceanica]
MVNAATNEPGEEELVRMLARDVNCMQDPDRMTRRRALNNLSSALVPGGVGGGQSTVLSPSPAAVCRFVQRNLQGPLLEVIEKDAVEKCRELALKILLAVVELMQQQQQQQQPPLGEEDTGLSTITVAFLPVAKRRIGVAPFLEPTEELRLAILHVLNVLLSTQAGWIPVLESKAARFPDFSSILVHELADSFPDAKRGACLGLGLAARYAPKALRLQQNVLLPPLLGNLGHQQSKVRQASLLALGNLLGVGNDSMARVVTDSVLPALKKLVFDRTPVLRRELVGVVGGWLQQGEDEGENAIPEDINSCIPYNFEGCEADLMFALLLGLSDEVPEVAEATREKVQAAGRAWVTRKEHQRRINSPSVEAEGSDSEGSSGAQRMVRFLLPSLLPKVLDDVGHWTLRMRHRSVLLLADVLRLAGPALVPFLSPTVSTLINAALDEEPEVRCAVAEAARALGEGVEISLPLDELLPLVRGARGAQMAERAAALYLLRSVLEGAVSAAAGAETSADAEKPAKAAATLGAGGEGPGKEILSSAEMEVLTRSLVDSSLLNVEEANEASLIALPLAEVLLSIVEAAPEGIKKMNFERRLVRVALQLLAVPLPESEERGFSVRGLVRRALKILAGREEESVGEGVVVLWERHFDGLLEEVVVGKEGWRKGSAGRMAFDTLVRECIRGTARQWDKIMAVITPQIVKGNDQGGQQQQQQQQQQQEEAELRLAHMLLLESLIDGSLPIAAKEVMEKAGERRMRQLLRDLLLPTIAWQAGRTAATVRKVGLVCLYRLLREGERGRLPRVALLEVAPLLLPVLQTNLDDYDATIRHLVALSISALFRAYRLSAVQGQASLLPPQAQILQVLPDLMRRLDDASNEVRQASCLALEGLFDIPGAASFFSEEPVLTAVVDQLLVHLDDAECAEPVWNVLDCMTALGIGVRRMVVERGSKGVHGEKVREKLGKPVVKKAS